MIRSIASTWKFSGIKAAELMTCPQCKTVEHRGSMKGKQSINMVRTTSAGPVRSAGLSLLLLSFFLYIADSYPNIEVSNMGCVECMPRMNTKFTFDRPIFQCMGCCFSRAYPTPLKALQSMTIRKNITSEAACCVAKHSYLVTVGGLQVRNHTECHCSNCYYHTI